jgi:hypothetical protein
VQVRRADCEKSTRRTAKIDFLSNIRGHTFIGQRQHATALPGRAAVDQNARATEPIQGGLAKVIRGRVASLRWDELAKCSSLRDWFLPAARRVALPPRRGFVIGSPIARAACYGSLTVNPFEWQRNVKMQPTLVVSFYGAMLSKLRRLT